MQKRHFLGKFFGRGAQKSCQNIEPLFRKVQETCEDQITALEATFDKASSHHLLQMLYKCQRVGIRDKFFYDSLIDRIFGDMDQIITASQMVVLGASLGTHKDL